jgi:hypothetical protein
LHLPAGKAVRLGLWILEAGEELTFNSKECQKRREEISVRLPVDGERWKGALPFYLFHFCVNLNIGFGVI